MKRLRQYVITLLLAAPASSLAQVQDVNFSQYFNFPGSSLPATTSVDVAKYRIAGIYRQQWQSIDAQFETYGVAADFRIDKSPLKKGAIGVGIYALDDHLGNNVIQQQEFGLNASIHYPLDFEEHKILSVALNTNYTLNSINYESLFFESQYSGFVLNRELPTGEDFTTDQSQNINFGVGLNYRYIMNPKTSFNIGGSLLEILEPAENFMNENFATGIHNKWNAYANSRHQIAPRYAQYIHAQMAMVQNANVVRIGTVAEYAALQKKELHLSAGLFYQLREAITIYSGFAYKVYSLNLSYDFTASTLNHITEAIGSSTANPGAFEISFVMKGFAKSANQNYLVPCRFF